MYQHQQAAYPYLWIASSEEDRIIRENRRIIPPEINFFRWDVADGFQRFVNADGNGTWIWKGGNEEVRTPPDALRACKSIPQDSIVFMFDFHFWLQDPEVQRCALNIKEYLKANRIMVAFLSYGKEIPAAVRDSIKVMEFAMPTEDELCALLEKTAHTKDEDGDVPGMPEKPMAIVEALRGLTLEGAENALALSLVQKGGFDYRIILNAKAAQFESTGYLKYTEYTETFSDLFGYEVPKELIPDCVMSDEGSSVIVFGVPGTGKSHFSKALGNETQKPVLDLNIGGLRGGIIGETERNTADAFRRIYAFNKPIVFIDEVEKALAGMGEGGKSDGGVGDRIGQELLKHMEDRLGEAYYSMTCNDLEPILSWSGGALASRADAIFFLDMPTKEECKGIARIWSEKKNVDIPGNFDFEGWTGRDIKKLARIMKMKDICADKAKEFVVPTAQMQGARLAELQKKAQNVCLSASKVEKVSPSIRKIKVAK